MKSINIPDKISHIGMSAFWGCSGLTELTIPDHVTNIESTAFYGCQNVTKRICQLLYRICDASCTRGCRRSI